tara:strand:+ start:46392 stop:47018 length:627 start_codon:yes stop_codon:yes gene_type:complete
MKELFLGVVLIILLGLGSFLYQNALRDRSTPEGPVACTLEARICPDGSAVGRTGPHCEFEACSTDPISFTAPNGFIDTLPLLSSIVEGRLGFYSKEPNVISNSISVHAFKTETPEEVILEKVTLTPSDLHPESLEDFEVVAIGEREVYRIVNERFEATVEVTYGIFLEDFLVLVALRDIAVENWMEDFDIEDLEDLETVEEVVRSIKI